MTEEFNVDSKSWVSSLSSTSTRGQKKSIKKKKLKQTNASAPLINSVHVKIREGSPEDIRATMEERICERDEF